MNFVLLMKLLFLINATTASYHPVHVSVTNIELKKQEHLVLYSIRIFADDFEYALMHLYEKEIILADGISEEENNMVVQYINKGFGIIVDGVKLQSACGEIKYQDNTTWIFCNIILPQYEIEKIKITNRILLDFFPDQTNLAVFSVDEYQEGFTFDYKNTETEIDINRMNNPKIQKQ